MVAGGLALLALSLGGCAPEPAPSTGAGGPEALRSGSLATPLPIAQKAFGFNGGAAGWGYTPEQWRGFFGDLHVNVSRISIQWDTVEKAPGSWDWTQADADVAGVLASGSRPLILVWAAPAWNRDLVDMACVDTNFIDCRYPHAAANAGRWRAYVAEVVRRYGHVAVGIEVWNEQNFAWRGGSDPSDPERYTRLLCDAHAEVKRLRPSLPVVFGSLSPGGKNIPPRDYWNRALLAGAGRCFDAMGVHPYAGRAPNNDPRSATWDSMVQLDTVRSVLTAHGLADARLWVTEWGYSTYNDSDGTVPGNNGHLDGVTESDQALFLPLGLRRLMEQPDVDMVIIHRLQDGGTDRNHIEHNFGMVRTDSTRKPSYQTLVDERAAQVSGL
jgi:hypothetical protein